MEAAGIFQSTVVQAREQARYAFKLFWSHKMSCDHRGWDILTGRRSYFIKKGRRGHATLSWQVENPPLETQQKAYTVLKPTNCSSTNPIQDKRMQNLLFSPTIVFPIFFTLTNYWSWRSRLHGWILAFFTQCIQCWRSEFLLCSGPGFLFRKITIPQNLGMSHHIWYALLHIINDIC